MEDVLTKAPPPSRFFEDELDNFATPSPPLPPPLLLLQPSSPTPELLLIFISPPSFSLLRRLPPSTAIAGTLILPEIPLSGQPILPTSHRPSCHLYALPPSTLLAAVRYSIAPDRARSVARSLLSGVPAPRVVVFDSIRGANYRGRLAADEPMAFKLETSQQKGDGGGSLRGLEYLPSGSVADGLGAALLAECQMRRIKGTLVVTWPDNGWAASPASMLMELMSDLGIDIGSVEGGDEFGSGATSDLYT